MPKPKDFTHTITAITSRSVNIPDVRVVLTMADGSTLESPLGLKPLVAGTSAECEIVVRDARVSRRHCELSLTERGIIITDLGSKNGTFIGAVQIDRAVLDIGVIATIGSVNLVARVAGAPIPVALSPAGRFGDAIGTSLPMRAMFAVLEHAAKVTPPVLLIGEPGTGKDTLAEALHEASPRNARPFIVFDCMAVPQAAMELELFGCAPGYLAVTHPGRAGRFDEVAGGTLYLNEPGELPFELQHKLLRALELSRFWPLGSGTARPLDAWTIAASRQNPRAQVTVGSFLRELHARLAAVEVTVPPLRERKDDIRVLVEYFLSNRKPPCALSDLSPYTMELLEGPHAWPGNVRDLRNTVERLALYPHLGREALVALLPSAMTASTGALDMVHRMTLREARELVVEEFEKDYLKNALEVSGGNVSEAAKAMGVSRQYLHRLLRHYGFNEDER